MKKVVIYSFLCIVLFISYMYCFGSVYFEDKVVITAKSLHEEGCDEYRNIWRIIDISMPKYSHLKDDIIYFEISRTSYELEDAPLYLEADGYLIKGKRTARHIGCQNVRYFKDEHIRFIDSITAYSKKL